MTQEKKLIAFALYPGVTPLDLVGPLTVLRNLGIGWPFRTVVVGERLETFAPQYRTVVVAERAEPTGSDVPLQMIPDRTFDEVPHPHIILVPGGRLPTIRAMSDPAMRAYVRSAAASAEIVASVCTGSLILASVGLLDGRKATTNWFWYGVLESFGAKYLPQRWVEDGRFIMSAGVSAGIDMALYLVSRLTDEATARRVQLALDYDPQPPFGRIDWAHVPRLPRLVRGGIRLVAPLIAARPKRLTTSDRRVPAQLSSASTS